MRTRLKRATSLLLALVMVFTLLPASALATGVNEDLVASLASIYGGDAVRAREDLEALRDAGIIDENGNLTALDVREDGVAVELDAVARRIAGGEDVGALTVNGNAATPEQLVQIYQVEGLLDVIRLLDEDVAVTDEHVANLQALLEGIADGSLDIGSAVRGGTLKMNRFLAAAPASDSTDTVDADSEGKYTAPYISGDSYEKDHSFTLFNPSNKSWYAGSQVMGVDGEVTLTCAGTASAGGKVTVTASLNKAQPVPVSFDWKAVGGAIGATGSGTVEWEAGDGEDKTFEVSVGAKEEGELWKGGRAFVISASNIQNACFAGGNFAWSKAVTVNANDENKIIEKAYSEQPTGTLTLSDFNRYVVQEFGHNDAFVYYAAKQKVSGMFPASGKFNVKVTLSGAPSALTSLDFFFMGPNTDISGTPSHTSSQGYKLDTYLYYTDKKPCAVLVFPSFRDKNVATASEKNFKKDYESGATGLPTTLDGIVKNNEVQLAACLNVYNWGSNPNIDVQKIEVSVSTPATHTNVTGVSIPEGSYSSGETVPVTVTLDNFAVAAAGARLTVNGVECAPLDTENTESNKLTFGYTVKEKDSGTLNVTGITGLKNSQSKDVSIDGSFPEASFGVEKNVTIVSDVKRGSLDMDNLKYGIDDASAGEQIFTVLIPFKSVAGEEESERTERLQWVVSEGVEIGEDLDLPVPDYENGKATHYLAGAYASNDSGATRYPLYVVNSGNTEGAALAIRFAPSANETPNLRKDTLELFLDPEVVTDPTTYLPAYSEMKTDEKGFVYAESDGADDAPILAGASWQYYVKGGVAFDKSQTTPRGTTPDVDNGFIQAGDNNYVLVQDAEHPENQYDVEITANTAFFNAVKKGVRVEEPSPITLRYQFSGRDAFTFTAPEYFEWSSSDENVAIIEKDDETGAGQVTFTGVGGQVYFTLRVRNGLERKAYELQTPVVGVLEGKTPFLNIPSLSRTRATLMYTDTDVVFASNVTARNHALGKNTTFTATLYKVNQVDDVPSGDPVWKQDFPSTDTNTVTHITVPGTQLTAAGVYAVVIETRYQGGKVESVDTEPMDFSATAYLDVKQTPAKVTLDTLDSYYVTYDKAPSAFKYTVVPASAEVEYTVQKSGEAVGDRKPASGGSIQFSAKAPKGLKDAYTVTVYARASANEPWSTDSLLLTVYNDNNDMLDIIIRDVAPGEIGGTTGGAGTVADGTTVAMDNHGKLGNYGISGEAYQLTYNDFTALRTDMSLQKIISANYGSGVWGMLSDKIQWSSGDPDTVSVDYKQGGIYADIRNYPYTSYAPATDFLLVGKGDTAEDGSVTVTATHANTGMTASFQVTATTLENQLYVFQFTPKAKTTVTYTNGKDVQRTLTSNDAGELAVYEPDGITGALMAMSQVGGDTYAGTLFPGDLASGERDIASLQLYPCNNLRLRAVSNATLTFLKPDGTPYSGPATIRAGVYKNGVYCPDALVKTIKNEQTGKNGRKDISVSVTDGKVSFWFDPMQFRNEQSNQPLDPRDTVTYVFEYRFDGSYQPGYVRLNSSTDLEGAARPTDSVVQLRDIRGTAVTPQLLRQTLQQYYGERKNSYSRDVTDYTENVGISTAFDKAELITDIALPGEQTGTDESGYATYVRESDIRFELRTSAGRTLTGQTGGEADAADQILDLSSLDEATLYVFPFSSIPMARSIYTMTDGNMSADGITDAEEGKSFSTTVKAAFIRDGVTVRSSTLPFGVSNLSHQKDLSQPDGGAAELGQEVQNNLKGKTDIGAIFRSINVNDMIKNGFVFLSKLNGTTGDSPINMMILPTQDPATFRIVAFIGASSRNNEDTVKAGENLTLNYNADDLFEDMNKFQKELKEQGKDKKSESNGEGSMSFNFYGSIILDARLGTADGDWDIVFRGGDVGTNVEGKYEWSNTFMCGPYPVLISFEVGFHADLEVSFGNKDTARAMLLDVAVGVSIEAFAGLGFDLSIVALKVGIFGAIGADVNFLLLTPSDEPNMTGTKLTITGEIGLKLEVKLLVISYSEKFASTGFDWTKKWNDYDKIKQYWNDQGYAQLTGFTQSGRAYSMFLFADGSSMVAIEGGGEIENRDYLELAERLWNSGAPAGRGLLKSAGPMTGALTPTDIQTNAYPYANPVLTDDGGMFLYLSDNDNSEQPQSTVSFAVNNGSGYEDNGAVDTNGTYRLLPDTGVVASGAGDKYFAAWVKQLESPDKEMKAKVSTDDLGMMMNATEVFAGRYDGRDWTVERLTDNTVGDMSPTVASSGNRAIVAWRSLSATEMPAEGGTQDLSAMFNAENNINYRVYNGTKWTDAQVAYNGASGTVNAIDSAMLSDGTAILVYTVRTGEDVTSTETFYTLVDKDGNILTTGRLTNDGYTDTNAQVTAVNDAENPNFVLAWYSEHDAGEGTTTDANGKEKPVVAHDIRLARINANGSVDADFPESAGAGSADIGSDFHFSAPADNTELEKVSIVWSQRKDSDRDEDAGKYELNAVRFFLQNGKIGVTAPTDIAETDKNFLPERLDLPTTGKRCSM